MYSDLYKSSSSLLSSCDNCLAKLCFIGVLGAVAVKCSPLEALADIPDTILTLLSFLRIIVAGLEPVITCAID